jgi:hypothetical protein
MHVDGKMILVETVQGMGEEFFILLWSYPYYNHEREHFYIGNYDHRPLNLLFGN